MYSQTNERLNYYKSTDGLTFNFVKTLLEKSDLVNSAYQTGLYRSSLVWDGTNYLFYISAESYIKGNLKYGILVAVGKTVETLQFINGNYSRKKQIFDAGIELVNNGTIASEIQLTNKGACIGIDYDTEKSIH